MSNNPEWLPELEGTIPKAAYDNGINIYSVVFEAWRRGLNVSFESVYSKSQKKYNIRYKIFNNKKNISFIDNRFESIPKSTINLTSSKLKTRKILAKKNIPVTRGKILSSINPEVIKTEVQDFEFPVNILELSKTKKKNGNYTAWNIEELIQVMSEKKDTLKSDKILIEEHSSEHYHAYIVGDEVIGAYKKVPPFIKGDGVKPIVDLIRETNDIVNQIPSVKNPEVKLNLKTEDLLRNQNYSFNSVPKAGDIIMLGENKNKEFPIDVTDDLSDKIKKNLVDIIKVIPDLTQGEVEFIHDKNTGEYRVYALNTNAGVRNYLYPLVGTARSVPKAIIDYHFPETKNEYLSDDTPKFYFDYDIIDDQLQNGRLSKVFIPKHRYEPNLVSKVIKFKSKYDIKRTQKMIKEHFLNLNFDGELNAYEQNQYEMIIAGNYQDMAYFYDLLHSKQYLDSIEYSDFTMGVRNGHAFNDFRLNKPIESSAIDNKDELEEDLILRKQIQHKNEKILELEQELEKLKKSDVSEGNGFVKTIKSKIRKKIK